MFENIHWNLSSIGVAALFILSAMIAAGAQIQVKDGLAYRKVDQQSAGCLGTMMGAFKWLSLLMAAVALGAMLLGFPFNNLSWWIASGWLVFIMLRGSAIVNATR